MAKIILLPDADTPNSPYIKAAWLLSYTILWNHSRLPIQEEVYAKNIIRHDLAAGNSLQQSFIAVIERLLLAGKLLRAEPAAWIDVPSIWFHPEYEAGFKSMLPLQQQVMLKRQRIHGYEAGITVFARAYWRYINNPSPAILQKCYKQLLRLREYSLLQLLGSIIFYQQITSIK